MPPHDAGESLAESEQREVFLALVEAQTRAAVAERFRVSEVEREGPDGEWPPWSRLNRREPAAPAVTPSPGEPPFSRPHRRQCPGPPAQALPFRSSRTRST